MNDESVKSSFYDNWLYVCYKKKRHRGLPDPAAPQQDSRALLLVVDDCAGDQGQPRLLSDCDSSWQRRDHFTTMSACWPHVPIVQATMTEHLHTLADRSDPCFSRKLHFIGAEWIYNVVIVSGVQQSDSVTHMHVSGASQVVLVIKDPPANAGDARDMGSIPGWVRSWEKKMATHSSILAWKIPWTEEPGGLQFMGPQRGRRDWAAEHTCIYLLFFRFFFHIEHWVEFHVLCSRFSAVFYFIHSSVYVSVPGPQFIPLLLFPIWCPYICSYVCLCLTFCLQIKSTYTICPDSTYMY